MVLVYILHNCFDALTPNRQENMIAVVSVVGINTKMAIRMARSRYTKVSVMRGLIKAVI